MATSNLSKKCETCHEETTTYPCPGCSKYFCINDLIKHREELEVKFHDIEHQRNQFAQTLDDHNKNTTNHPLFNKINQWERTSIDNIQRTAQEQRNILQQSIHQYTQHIQANLATFTEQIKQTEKKRDFNEMILNNLKKQLENLQKQLNQPTNIDIREDSSPTFINKISIIINSFQDPPPTSSTSTTEKTNSSYPTNELPSSTAIKKTENYDTKPKNEQFANGGASKHQYCNGRLCANCGKCRDWYFTGDRQTWNWVRNCNAWTQNDWNRYRDDRVYEHFKRRDGASCDFFDDFFLHCFCENNVSP